MTTATLAAAPLCEFAVELEPAQVFPTPFGTRLTLVLREGTVRGERLRGTFLPGGGDWLLLGGDGLGRIDVRATIRTDDGALIHLENRGVIAFDAPVLARLRDGGRVEWDEVHARSAPRFETGDERYAWLNRVVAVAHHALAPDHVDYRVFEVL